jgi:ketopantoate reductase
MQPLLGPDTAIVSAVNGVPWWYFYKLPGPWEDRRVESVDPGGELWETLHPSRAIGCIVYPAAEVTAPGVIEHGYGDRFSLGEPDGAGATGPTRCRRRWCGGVQGAGAAAHPRRDVGEALGQPRLQPAVRADGRDARTSSPARASCARCAAP